jgi:hypothetical protein
MNFGEPMSDPAAEKHRRRGLYVALGSIITVAVLAAAAIEAPKLIHGGLSGAAAPQPTATKDAAGDATSAPATPAGTPDSGTSDSTTPDLTAPAQPSPAPARNARASASNSNSGSGASAQPEKPAPWTRVPGAPASSSEAAASPDSVAAAVPSSPGQAAQPIPAPQSSAPAAANPSVELRDRFNQLSIRAGTARSGLVSFERQQSGQGLGLRGDIREAQTRMDFQLREALMSLQNGDFESARRSMGYAQNAVETIEKFLGR